MNSILLRFKVYDDFINFLSNSVYFSMFSDNFSRSSFISHKGEVAFTSSLGYLFYSVLKVALSKFFYEKISKTLVKSEHNWTALSYIIFAINNLLISFLYYIERSDLVNALYFTQIILWYFKRTFFSDFNLSFEAYKFSLSTAIFLVSLIVIEQYKDCNYSDRLLFFVNTLTEEFTEGLSETIISKKELANKEITEKIQTLSLYSKNQIITKSKLENRINSEIKEIEEAIKKYTDLVNSFDQEVTYVNYFKEKSRDKRLLQTQLNHLKEFKEELNLLKVNINKFYSKFESNIGEIENLVNFSKLIDGRLNFIRGERIFIRSIISVTFYRNAQGISTEIVKEIINFIGSSLDVSTKVDTILQYILFHEKIIFFFTRVWFANGVILRNLLKNRAFMKLSPAQLASAKAILSSLPSEKQLKNYASEARLNTWAKMVSSFLLHIVVPNFKNFISSKIIVFFHIMLMNFVINYLVNFLEDKFLEIINSTLNFLKLTFILNNFERTLLFLTDVYFKAFVFLKKIDSTKIFHLSCLFCNLFDFLVPELGLRKLKFNNWAGIQLKGLAVLNKSGYALAKLNTSLSDLSVNNKLREFSIFCIFSLIGYELYSKKLLTTNITNSFYYIYYPLMIIEGQFSSNIIIASALTNITNYMDFFKNGILNFSDSFFTVSLGFKNLIFGQDLVISEFKLFDKIPKVEVRAKINHIFSNEALTKIKVIDGLWKIKFINENVSRKVEPVVAMFMNQALLNVTSIEKVFLNKSYYLAISVFSLILKLLLLLFEEENKQNTFLMKKDSFKSLVTIAKAIFLTFIIPISLFFVGITIFTSESFSLILSPFYLVQGVTLIAVYEILTRLLERELIYVSYKIFALTNNNFLEITNFNNIEILDLVVRKQKLSPSVFGILILSLVLNIII